MDMPANQAGQEGPVIGLTPNDRSGGAHAA